MNVFAKSLRSLMVPGLLLMSASSAWGSYVERPEVRDFIDRMASQHGFAAEELTGLFERVERQQSILDAIARPAEAKPWHEYRPIFLKEKRIRQGVEFWRQHETLLREVEKQYGVPPAVIVAIVGVETRYGGYTGKHRILDSLTTLAFDYPKRGDFFRSELEQFFLLTREEGIDPVDARGSYAGAMGMPQFISSSYRHYAVDHDGDGRRDLWQSPADIIASVANYFQRHGWQAGEPVAAPATLGQATAAQKATRKAEKPRYSVAELEQAGVRSQAGFAADASANLLELDGKAGPEYWLALQNFYVISRYNHSPLYSMAVFHLSEEIARRYRAVSAAR